MFSSSSYQRLLKIVKERRLSAWSWTLWQTLRKKICILQCTSQWGIWLMHWTNLSPPGSHHIFHLNLCLEYSHQKFGMLLSSFHRSCLQQPQNRWSSHTPEFTLDFLHTFLPLPTKKKNNLYYLVWFWLELMKQASIICAIHQFFYFICLLIHVDLFFVDSPTKSVCVRGVQEVQRQDVNSGRPDERGHSDLLPGNHHAWWAAGEAWVSGKCQAYRNWRLSS